jgi:hypothetical protein
MHEQHSTVRDSQRASASVPSVVRFSSPAFVREMEVGELLSRFTPASPCCFGPSTLRPTMPSADSRCTVRMDHSILSHDSATCGGSPEVSSAAFRAQPPDLPPVLLLDMDFAISCSLVPHRRPLHPVLVHRLAPLIRASFRPRFAATPLRFAITSPLSVVVKRTFTFELSNMSY